MTAVVAAFVEAARRRRVRMLRRGLLPGGREEWRGDRGAAFALDVPATRGSRWSENDEDGGDGGDA